MMLAADHSDLPRGAGNPPNPEIRFAHLLAEVWQPQIDNLPHAIPGTRFRHSDAGSCARLLAYKAAGIERSDPMDLSGVWNVNLGSLIHLAWQDVIRQRYPEADIEAKVQIDGFDGSGHIDAVIRLPLGGEVAIDDRWTISYELKSIGGWGHKNAIGKAAKGRPAEGPRFGHIVQAALNGLACDADEIMVGYLAKEALSVNVADGMPDWARFCAEWSYSRAEFEPIARAEIARVEGILALIDDGLLAARKIPHETPAGAEITDPAKSVWTQTAEDGTIIDVGAAWGGSLCSYCGHQTLCAQTASGRIPVADVVKIRSEMGTL